MAIQRNQTGEVSDLELGQFARDVDEGLSAAQKRLSSKYFYDDNGSRLFQQIMQMPEYYLTDCEQEILQLQAAEIGAAIELPDPFRLIELGAGDGQKSQFLLKQLLEDQRNFVYAPVDISAEANQLLEERMKAALPGLRVESITSDYFELLADPSRAGGEPVFLMFLGSNIGNFPAEAAVSLLQKFAGFMQAGDKLLIGFDLKKDPGRIKLAYDDPHGITRAFNLNLLLRINRELGADFMPDQFEFYSHYDPLSGEVRSFLVSQKAQDVHIDALEKTYQFDRFELIWTEVSKKYSLAEIEELALAGGFRLKNHFLDCKHFFCDSLWERSA